MNNIDKHKADLLRLRIRKKDVSGVSMFPYIKPEDSVNITSKKNYYFGDVVVFESKGKLLVHRIIIKSGNKYFIKGDHNLVADGWVKHEKIIGKVNSINGVVLKKSLRDVLICFWSILSLPISLIIILFNKIFSRKGYIFKFARSFYHIIIAYPYHFVLKIINKK